MTGKQIYDNFTNSVGSDRLSAGAAIANEVAAKYGERARGVQRLIGKMDAAWQGDAAGAAMRGFGPVGVEHELAGQALATAQDLTNRQAGSFGDARNAVMPVPPEPVAPDPWAVFTSPGEVTSFYQQVKEYNAANQHNVDVMTGYSKASVYNANGLPHSYGALTPDQAGMTIDPGTSDTSGGSDNGSPVGGRSGAEWAGRGSGRESPLTDAGSPASAAGSPPPGAASGPLPPDGDGAASAPQQTTPGGFTPPPSGPATRVPVDTGGLASGPPPGGPGSGWPPGTGFVPVGGAPDGGRGAGGPGGRGGVPGSGSGSEVRGPGGRAGGGEPHGSGGRLGAGPLAGGTSAEPHAAGRGGAGGAAGRGGALGGMPLAAGGRPRGEDDVERRSPSYLQEDDPEGAFGTDELTAPPVIGEDLESPESDERPSTG